MTPKERAAISIQNESETVSSLSMLRMAMQQALDALEEYRDTQMILAPRRAITALREALAEQAEQEPVAWKDIAFARLGVVRDKMRPEDVEVVQRFLDGVYAAPVRTKDLTDDEILIALDVKDKCSAQNYKLFLADARAVIAAYKEKNNANNNT